MNRPKAEITCIGSFDEQGQPIDWMFDGHGKGAALEFTATGILYGGYTVAELQKIAKEAGMNGPDKPTPPLIDKIWAVVTAHGEVLGEHLTYHAAFLLSKSHDHGFVVSQQVVDKAKLAKENDNVNTQD